MGRGNAAVQILESPAPARSLFLLSPVRAAGALAIYLLFAILSVKSNMSCHLLTF
jgi:hypothetical protein